MLEIVFSQSAAGSLKYARSFTPKISSRSNEILCFSMNLSVGELFADCLSDLRTTALLRVYKNFVGEHPHMLQNQADAKKNMTVLLTRAAGGEPVRIWYSDSPDEYCGMCWLISVLKDRLHRLPPVYLMALPAEILRDKTVLLYQNWGEVCPEDFCDLLPIQKTASPAFLAMAKARWDEAVLQNMPLRTLINGCLTGVPEDFYDFVILKELEQEEREFSEAYLIGHVLGRHQLKIGDLWIAARIEALIQKGLLIPMTEPENGDLPYRRMLQKNISSSF